MAHVRRFSREELDALWKKYDDNGNGLVSLGEVHRAVTKEFPCYNSPSYKPALVRAYKLADKDNSGLITKDEFPTLMRALSYFTDLWERFQKVDVDGDNSMTLQEFLAGREILGFSGLDETEATNVFRRIDEDGSGSLRFFELGTYLARELALADKLSKADEEEERFIAPRIRRPEVGSDIEPQRKNTSHDGLLLTAPRGTQFEESWLAIVAGMDDLERQSVEGEKGLTESSNGGRGGRMAREGHRFINRRRWSILALTHEMQSIFACERSTICACSFFARVDTLFQDSYAIPSALAPLHAIADGDLPHFPDALYHTYKLKMLSSPLFETARFEYAPCVQSIMLASVRGTTKNSSIHMANIRPSH